MSKSQALASNNQKTLRSKYNDITCWSNNQRWADRYFGPPGPLSAAQRTTEMIVEQRTGKNSGPALADYRNGASAIPLFCICWPILKNISKRRNYQIMEVDPDTDTDTDTAE
jgi:hypothetical protein